MGYHQIDMNPSDTDKTAFSTWEEHWAYKRLSFGLKALSATFKRMMNNVLIGLSGARCVVFLDDIVIYTYSFVDHDRKLRDVFEKFRKHNLIFQPSKCEFLRKEITFLSHKISYLS